MRAEMGPGMTDPGYRDISDAGTAFGEANFREEVARRADLLCSLLEEGACAEFEEAFGIPLHVAKIDPRRGPAALTPMGRTDFCLKLRDDPGQVDICSKVERCQLARALASGMYAHTFTCPHGISNCWLPLMVGGRPVAVVFFQFCGPDGVRPLFPGEDAPADEPASAIPHWDGRQRRAASGFLDSLVHGIVDGIGANDPAEGADSQNTPGTRAPDGDAGRASPLGERDLVRAVLAAVEKEYRNPLTVQILAKRFGVGCLELSMAFARARKISFARYLTEFRVRKAREILSEDPGIPLERLAAEIGWGDAASLVRAFVRVTGRPPPGAREEQGDSPQDGVRDSRGG